MEMVLNSKMDSNGFGVIKLPNSLNILLQSSFENIDRVNAETKNFLIEKGLKSETFSVCLVLREGLTNAVRHAHKYDESKIIKYSLKIRCNCLIMTIEDQGDGFDWVSAKKRNPPPESDHGRGISIMTKYFNRCRYNKKGNKLMLIKVLDTK
ncbi:MAG: ATP-binding protein [Desulfobacterales bacterium]|nr:ATP-binding protein [Desulfobacterales bacterium]